MNVYILKPEVQQFLAEHLTDDVGKIALSKSPFENVSPRELAEQLDGKQRTQKKLPLWGSTLGIFFPPKLSIEQSSSELTAAYKCRLIKGNKLIDLTGGFGVDALYFSKYLEAVVHCEQNTELSEIAKYNSSVLGATNITFINANSLEYLKESNENFDTIFVDPSRRIESKKVFMLKDTQPDVVSNLPLLLSKASRIVIKTSPLVDIQLGLAELSHVSEVHVVSVKNDCKELLWVIDKGFDGEAKITSAAIGLASEQLFSFTLSDEKCIKLPSFSPPLTYVYEPDVALLKAGCFKSIAIKFEISKLHPNTHLYTADKLVADFPGKIFQVNKVWDYRAFIKDNPTKKANVIAKNFPDSPEALKKKHKISDGGNDFLIFTTTFSNTLQVIDASLFHVSKS